MRLIDAKELLNERPESLNPNMNDEIKSAHNKGWNACNSKWISLIDEQPTAYDIDKIMEQLERCLIGWMPDETIYEVIKLLKEGGEEEIDWSQVEVDTPILVRDSVGEPWHRGYFAKYDNGTVFTWMFTFTSQNTPNGNISAWRFAELEEAGEENDI